MVVCRKCLKEISGTPLSRKINGDEIFFCCQQHYEDYIKEHGLSDMSEVTRNSQEANEAINKLQIKKKTNIKDKEPDSALMQNITELVIEIAIPNTCTAKDFETIKTKCYEVTHNQNIEYKILERFLSDNKQILINKMCGNLFNNNTHALSYLFVIIRNAIGNYRPIYRTEYNYIDSNPVDDSVTVYQSKRKFTPLDELINMD